MDTHTPQKNQQGKPKAEQDQNKHNHKKTIDKCKQRTHTNKHTTLQETSQTQHGHNKQTKHTHTHTTNQTQNKETNTPEQTHNITE